MLGHIEEFQPLLDKTGVHADDKVVKLISSKTAGAYFTMAERAASEPVNLLCAVPV